MNTFKDVNGKSWTVAVTVGSAMRVKEMCQIDLLKLDESLYAELGDPYKLVGVLYALCMKQAESSSITPEQFGEGLCGDAIEHATDALLGAVADFFPSRRRTLLQKMTTAIKGVESLQLQKAETALENVNVEQIVSDLMAKANVSGESSSKLPEPSGSPPSQELSAS